MKFIITLLFCFFIAGKSLAEVEKNIYEKIDLFSEVLSKIDKEYVESINQNDVMDAAINGVLQSLDPYSAYMSPEMFEEMQTETSGEFGGLGIEVTMENGYVKVISPIEDTPAYQAGILAGDFIVQIDDTPVFGLTLSEAVDLMRGDKGEPITITISREGEELFEVNIIRDIIKIQSVKYEIFDNVGYLRITSFTEQTESGLIKYINKIVKKILDVKFFFSNFYKI